MWRILDVVPGIVWAALCVALAIASGWNYVGKVRAEGELTEVKAEVSKAQAETARQLQLMERAAREREQKLQSEVERISNESVERQEVLVARVASSDRAVARLRGDIARLNARPAPSAENPIAAAYAREASVARELLGACGEEYRNVARDADGLRDQVIGLQAYVGATCNNNSP